MSMIEAQRFCSENKDKIIEFAKSDDIPIGYKVVALSEIKGILESTIMQLLIENGTSKILNQLNEK